MLCFFFFFNDTATTEIYTLSLHDALPILFPIGDDGFFVRDGAMVPAVDAQGRPDGAAGWRLRSEEHTSELQSQSNLVCRLLLEKKKKTKPQRAVTLIEGYNMKSHSAGNVS